MAENIGGVQALIIDNDRFIVGDSCRWSIDPVERETASGLGGIAGYTEKAVPPFVEAEVFNTARVDIAALSAKVNATVILQAPNGKNVAIRNCWRTTVLEVDQATGKFTLRMEGMSGEEIGGTS